MARGVGLVLLALGVVAGLGLPHHTAHPHGKEDITHALDTLEKDITNATHGRGELEELWPFHASTLSLRQAASFYSPSAVCPTTLPPTLGGGCWSTPEKKERGDNHWHPTWMAQLLRETGIHGWGSRALYEVLLPAAGGAGAFPQSFTSKTTFSSTDKWRVFQDVDVFSQLVAGARVIEVDLHFAKTDFVTSTAKVPLHAITTQVANFVEADVRHSMGNSHAHGEAVVLHLRYAGLPPVLSSTTTAMKTALEIALHSLAPFEYFHGDGFYPEYQLEELTTGARRLVLVLDKFPNDVISHIHSKGHRYHRHSKVGGAPSSACCDLHDIAFEQEQKVRDVSRKLRVANAEHPPLVTLFLTFQRQMLMPHSLPEGATYSSVDSMADVMEYARRDLGDVWKRLEDHDAVRLVSVVQTYFLQHTTLVQRVIAENRRRLASQHKLGPNTPVFVRIDGVEQRGYVVSLGARGKYRVQVGNRYHWFSGNQLVAIVT